MTLSRRQLLASVFAAPVVGVEALEHTHAYHLAEHLKMTMPEGVEGQSGTEGPGGEPVLWRNPITGKWASCDEAGNVLSQGDRLNHEKFFELLMGRKP